MVNVRDAGYRVNKSKVEIKYEKEDRAGRRFGVLGRAFELTPRTVTSDTQMRPFTAEGSGRLSFDPTTMASRPLNDDEVLSEMNKMVRLHHLPEWYPDNIS